MSSTDILEGSTPPELAEATHDHSHAEQGDGHDHDHHDHQGQDHGHHHAHEPNLNPDCTRELVLDIPAEEVSKTYGKLMRKYKQAVKIPGFRVGKVPDSVLKRRFGAEIKKEVIDTLLPERFNQAVTDLGVKPVGQPRVTELTVEDGAPLHVKAVFEFVSPFLIEGYRDVIVDKPSAEITEEEFQRELEQLRESRATMEPVEEDRPLEDGDWAQISYQGQLEDGGAPPIVGEDTLVEVGGKHTFEAFTSVLRGARSGQELKAEVVYPADYGDAGLAGKTVVYDLEVKSIKRRILPDLDDSFASELGDYENFAVLEARIRENMAQRKRRRVQAETTERLMTELAGRYAFPIPETLVQEQVDARLDNGLRALAAQGMEPEQMRKLDFARLRTVQRDGAAAEVKTFILLDRIADEENIEVSNEEVDSAVQLAAYQSGEPVEDLWARLTEDGGLARIRVQLRREKTASILYERLPG